MFRSPRGLTGLSALAITHALAGALSDPPERRYYPVETKTTPTKRKADRPFKGSKAAKKANRRKR